MPRCQSAKPSERNVNAQWRPVHQQNKGAGAELRRALRAEKAAGADRERSRAELARWQELNALLQAENAGLTAACEQAHRMLVDAAQRHVDTIRDLGDMAKYVGPAKLDAVAAVVATAVVQGVAARAAAGAVVAEALARAVVAAGEGGAGGTPVHRSPAKRKGGSGSGSGSDSLPREQSCKQSCLRETEEKAEEE